MIEENGMAIDTREKLLSTAEALFAERGFYGVSIAAIANELSLTKQALLHHFGSKEKLYGEVLQRISKRIEQLHTISDRGELSPKARLKSYLVELNASMASNPNQTRVLMRELLDNRRRADSAGTWFLKPFLNELIDMLLELPNWQNASRIDALAVIYQILGAISYYGVSEPTLTGIFGKKAFRTLDAGFPGHLECMIDRLLN